MGLEQDLSRDTHLICMSRDVTVVVAETAFPLNVSEMVPESIYGPHLLSNLFFRHVTPSDPKTTPIRLIQRRTIQCTIVLCEALLMKVGSLDVNRVLSAQRPSLAV